MIDWTTKIKVGTEIQVVKNNQPHYIEIEWKKPDTLGKEVQYLIAKIKGNRDVLGMSNYLVFKEGKYQGRRPHK